MYDQLYKNILCMSINDNNFYYYLFPRICKAYCAIAFLYTKSVTPNTTALFPDLMSALAVSAEASNLESEATNKIVGALAASVLSNKELTSSLPHF